MAKGLEKFIDMFRIKDDYDDLLARVAALEAKVQ